MQKEAMLYEALENGRVQCNLCAHRCRISPGKHGVCGVRGNDAGVLHTFVYGKAIAANVDPIEKKPLYHFLPGSYSYSIATAGCNFRCGFCQNWNISQLSAKNGDIPGKYLAPDHAVDRAVKSECRSIAYTYTEPTVFFEYAFDTAVLAKQSGLYNVFVTNGFMTREAIDTIKPYLDAANIDLKSFRDEYYKKYCKGRLTAVTESIAYMRQLGIWVEVTTLIIPGENDSDEEMEDIASFIVQVDRDIPWHISRFHPDYRFTGHSATPLATMQRARETGMRCGLRYIYLGNVYADSDTRCPGCGATLIQRSGFSTSDVKITGGRCPSCGTAIAGIW